MKNTFTLSINVRLKVTRVLCILIDTLGKSLKELFKKTINKGINTALHCTAKITSEENEDTIIEQSDYLHFTPLILSAINDIRGKKSVLTPLLWITHNENASIECR